LIVDPITACVYSTSIIAVGQDGRIVFTVVKAGSTVSFRRGIKVHVRGAGSNHPRIPDEKLGDLCSIERGDPIMASRADESTARIPGSRTQIDSLVSWTRCHARWRMARANPLHLLVKGSYTILSQRDWLPIWKCWSQQFRRSDVRMGTFANAGVFGGFLFTFVAQERTRCTCITGCYRKGLTVR
jgi:hypothetical protein